MQIEGDADHPVMRTLCPKGAALLDFVHAETSLADPVAGDANVEPPAFKAVLVDDQPICLGMSTTTPEIQPRETCGLGEGPTP